MSHWAFSILLTQLMPTLIHADKHENIVRRQLHLVFSRCYNIKVLPFAAMKALEFNAENLKTQQILLLCIYLQR